MPHNTPARITRVFLCLSLAGTLTACSSNQLTPAQQTALAKQHAAQKTLEFSCTGPCSLSYKDPRDKLTLPQSTNGYDVATVVTAPDPVIVNQSPPVVVQQPAPVIVQGVAHE